MRDSIDPSEICIHLIVLIIVLIVSLVRQLTSSYVLAIILLYILLIWFINILRTWCRVNGIMYELPSTRKKREFRRDKRREDILNRMNSTI